MLKLENTPYFTLSTRSNSLKNKIVHDFFMSISGKNCNRIKIMIFINEYALLPEINNLFGQIHFDNGNEYNFDFFVIKRRNKNIIGFYPNNNVDMLILNMQKCEFMSITMPSVGKKIFYDLRGFSKSFQRAALMCNSTRAN